MVTYKRITDPQQARELYELGLLMFSKTLMCDRSWTRDFTTALNGNPNHLEDVVSRGKREFYIRLED